MRPSSVVPARRFRTLLLPLAVLGLAAAFHVSPVEARPEPQAELARCDFDPRFGGSVANRVGHGFGFGITVDNPLIAPDGLTYASLSELILPSEEHPNGGVRLQVIRFDTDGQLDRTYGDNGFAHVPMSGYIVSMAIVDGGILALTSEFRGEATAAMVRLTGDGRLDLEFGDSGVVNLGKQGRANDLTLTGIVGPRKTDVFTYDIDSSRLSHFEVDHHGRVQVNSITEVLVGSFVGTYSNPDGQILLMTHGAGAVVEREEEPSSLRQDLGNGATVITTSPLPLGRDGERIWLVGSRFDGAGRALTSVDLGGNTIRSTVVNLGADQRWPLIEAAVTLPSGEILIMLVDRSPESGPVGTIYRFPDFESLSEGPFTRLRVDLNKPESYPPPTEMLLDAGGGAHIFSGSWGTSTGHVTRTRVLPHPVAAPEAGAMVDQVDRLYLAAFGRIADGPGLGYWLDQRASGLPIISVADLFVQSAEFRSIYASPDEAAFVEILYGNVLGRPSDSEGLAYWTSRLTSGDLTRAQVLLAFGDSPEHVNTTASLAPNDSSWTGLSRLYETALDRPADVEGFCYFVAEMQDGQQLSWVAQQMLVSPEFMARQDGTDAGVVSALYQGAFDRSPSETELSYWVSQLSSGTSQTTLLLHISNSPEALRRLGY